MFFNRGILFACTLILLTISCTQPLTVKKIVELKQYASGSGLAYLKQRIYLIGDDMSYLLIADTSFTPIDSIQLLSSKSVRIAKSIKQDIEAISLVRLKKSTLLLLPGSGSVHPFRYFCWLVNPLNKQKQLLDLGVFYKRIQAAGIRELNIEGITSISGGGMILANRGNKSYTKNHLIFTNQDFWNNQHIADLKIIKLGANTDTAFFNGVSGLEYSSKSDCLLLTVSTENTYDSKTDGGIGKSYLWIINNISTKKRLTAINPNRVIDLNSLDDRFRTHKIESVCIVSENKSEYDLVLVADDDKGNSLLFYVILKKKG